MTLIRVSLPHFSSRLAGGEAGVQGKVDSGKHVSSLSVGQLSGKLLPQQVHGQAQIQDGEIDCASLVRGAARSQDLAKEKGGSILAPAPSFYLVPSHPLTILGAAAIPQFFSVTSLVCFLHSPQL